jgi:hypothetical protein
MTGQEGLRFNRAGHSVWKSLAWLGSAIATTIAAGLAALLALVFAATVLVIALITSVLVAVAGLALRARRTAKPDVADDGVIEAHKVGGHSWVAYGWDERKS